MAVLTGDDTYVWTDGDGVVFSMGDRNQFLVLPGEGFGLSDLELVVRETAGGHGGNWNYTRLKPKKFSLNILAKAANWSDQQFRRQDLINAFSPIKGKGTLTIYRVNGTVRAIDAVIDGGLKFLAAGRRGMSRVEQISFLGDHGVWYDPRVATGTMAFGTLSGGVLPLTLPATLGTSATPVTTQMANDGDWDSYPVFVIPGPATNPMILNSTTGLYVRYIGSIATGYTLTIDCSFDSPALTITNTVGTTSSGWSMLDRTSQFFPIRRGKNAVVYNQDNNYQTNSITYTYKHVFSGI